jgi:hypothetical protein
MAGGLGGLGGLGGMDPFGTALAFFIDKGYSPPQAAGIVGNLVQESGVNPNGPRGDNGTAAGIAQWRGDRLANLQRFAASAGADPKDLLTQLEFVHRELGGPERSAYTSLKASDTAPAAARAFVGFERPQGWRPGDPSGAHGLSNRVASAVAAEPVARQLAAGDEATVPALPTSVIPTRPLAASFPSDAGTAMPPPSGSPAMPQPAGFDVGNVLGAIGSSLLTSPRNNPLGGLPAAIQAREAQRMRLAQMGYEQAKDQRDYGLRREQFDVSKSNTADDNKRAWAQFDESKLTPAAKAARDMGLAPGTPEYSQFLAQQYKPGNDFSVIGEDEFGNKRYGWVNKTTQDVTPFTPPGGSQPLRRARHMLQERRRRMPCGRLLRAPTRRRGARRKRSGWRRATSPCRQRSPAA